MKLTEKQKEAIEKGLEEVMTQAKAADEILAIAQKANIYLWHFQNEFPCQLLYTAFHVLQFSTGYFSWTCSNAGEKVLHHVSCFSDKHFIQLVNMLHNDFVAISDDTIQQEYACHIKYILSSNRRTASAKGTPGQLINDLLPCLLYLDGRGGDPLTDAVAADYYEALAECANGNSRIRFTERGFKITSRAWNAG